MSIPGVHVKDVSMVWGGVLQEQTRTDILVTTFLCTGVACDFYSATYHSFDSFTTGGIAICLLWQSDFVYRDTRPLLYGINSSN
jgi:hypothetical protein